MRLAVVLVMLAACGRLGFDPRGATGDGGAGDGGTGDGAQRDGASAGSGHGSVVQQSPVTTGNGTVVVSLPLPTMGGTYLVATIAGNNIAMVMTPSGWSSSASGSTSGACGSVILTEPNAAAGQTTITFTINTPCAVQVTEWAGLAGVDNGGFTGAVSPTTSLTVSTVIPDNFAGDLAIATFCQDTTMPLFTAGAGWSPLGQIGQSAALPSLFVEYQTGEPKAQVTATGTSSVAAKYAGALVTFLAP